MIVVALIGLLLVAGLTIAHRTQASATIGSGNSGNDIPVGSSTQTFSFAGRTRSYIVYRPNGLTGAAPLVMMLHGGGGSAARAEQIYGWNSQADRQHFLVAYPDSVGVAWNTGGGCCGQAAALDVDDVGFVSEVVRQISREIPVDQTRIYATGMSNGGILAYSLACHTSIFAAIGPVSATQLGTCHQPGPISMIQIHGTADPNIPYDGSQGTGVAQIDGPAIPTLDAAWRQIDQCAPPVVTKSSTAITSVANCPDGRNVELISVIGGEHEWPHTGTLDATSAVWQFFTEHHR